VLAHLVGRVDGAVDHSSGAGVHVFKRTQNARP
jgi:hypothetical protein